MAAVRWWASVLCVMALWSAPARASEYLSVSIGAHADRREAMEAAKRASARLNYPLARETLADPPHSPRFGGRVVAVHREAGKYVVTVFLGDEEEGALAFNHASALFRETKKQAREVERLDASYLAHVPLSVVVGGVRQNYEEAVRLAQHLSARTGIPYSSRGMVFTKERGLIWPEDSPDPVLAGSYFARRANNCGKEMKECISVERSEFYQGFEPGYFIVVAGIFKSGLRSSLRAEKLREFSSQAHSKNTTIYLGCMQDDGSEPARLVDDDGDAWLTMER